MVKNALAAVATFALLGAAAYASFFIAPTDAKQGLIYRILFLHVSSAWTGTDRVLYLLSSRTYCMCGAVSRDGIGSAFPPLKLVLHLRA